jgi:hypothetical protein
MWLLKDLYIFRTHLVLIYSLTNLILHMLKAKTNADITLKKMAGVTF